MHSLALTRLGRIFSWGRTSAASWASRHHHSTSRDAQQFFAPHEVPFDHAGRVVQVSAGANHNVVVTSDGALFSWGDNPSGN